MAHRNQHRHNHAARMEQKAQTNQAAGLVSEKYPAVSGIVIHMTYYRKAAIPLLMVRTLNIYPTSYANFRMDCMTKGCDGGGFDLTASIASMVKSRTKVSRGSIICHGKINALSARHAHIEYETVIKYTGAKEARS